jgi:Carboxypeptidase regulatory-like domain
MLSIIRILTLAHVLSAMLPLQGMFAVTGVVTDAEGNPLPGAAIRIAELPERQPAIADDAGKFVLAELAPGTYHVRVDLSGFRAQTQSVELRNGSPARQLQFTLPVGLLIEALQVHPDPREAIRRSVAVAHIRLLGVAPPLPCSEWSVVTAVHDAEVLTVLRGSCLLGFKYCRILRVRASTASVWQRV